MTSHPPAQPWPPHPSIITTGWQRQRSFNSVPSSRRSSVQYDASQDGMGDVQISSDQDGRPAKRRRVDSQVSSPTAESVVGPGQLLVVDVEDDTSKRYHSSAWVAAVSDSPMDQASTKEDGKKVWPLPRIPWRGCQLPEILPPRVRTSCRYRPAVKVPNTPGSLLRATDAPVLMSKKTADYFPWMGNHPEDMINESNVKSGYSDRAPAPADKESNTAKAPLYTAFKHKSGLESLSALFSHILEQKSKRGALSSVSTFKPPPRVTLTEAKRRSWIAELADAGVPLRRLSRTIPQGIKGLALLEQCLVNQVPIHRAIWFVKCVGANEIRTLKRKGITNNVTAGAEKKWLIDWSINVEQFLESAINQCGGERTNNMKYSLHMCTRLYLQNLVERDHFLDWMVKNVTNCTLETLAGWLLLARIYKQDLVRFRKRARLMAGAYLARLKEMTEMNSTENILKQRLHATIRDLVYSRPACFLMPDHWQEYSQTLRACLAPADDKDQQIFAYIDSRNQRVLGNASGHNEENARPEKAVFDTLDEAAAPYEIHQLSEKLFAICPDVSKVGSWCLLWATTRFRGGKSRIYLIARLFRRWQRAGAVVDPVLLDFFGCNYEGSAVDIDNYRHLFAELSRTRSFSNSRFLQSVSVRGSIPGSTQLQDSQEVSFLLRDLCLSDTEDHMLHLRDHLVKKLTGHHCDDREKIDLVWQEIRQSLKDAENNDAAMLHEKLSSSLEAVRGLAWSSKFEISKSLRMEAGALSEAAANEIPDKPPLPGSRPFTLSQFIIIRDALEAIGDYAVLADVLHMLGTTKQETILVALVDTVHCNMAVLSAIGAFEALQKLYGQAYIALRLNRPCILRFTIALTDLCQHFPSLITPVRALQQDLLRGDRGRALAACSPFSDGAAESLQQAGETFIDDFEAILQGEPHMNEQTMSSLFTVLVGRITKGEGDGPSQSLPILCQLLSRLRLFRTYQGDALIKKWLARLFSASWSDLHLDIVLELLLARCVSAETLLDVIDQAPPASSCRGPISDLLVTALIAPPAVLDRRQHRYVVRIAVKQLINKEPIRVLRLILSRYAVGGTMQTELSGICATLLPKILLSTTNVCEISDLNSKALITVIDTLLGMMSKSGDNIQQIISRVNWLSLPFCRARLPTLLSALESQATNEMALNMVKALRLDLNAKSMDAELIRALLQNMPNDLQDHIRGVTERQFFESMPKFFQMKSILQPLHVPVEEKTRSLQALAKVVSLGFARPSSTCGDSNGMMIEKLTIVAKALGARNEVAPTNLSSNANTVSSPVSPAYQSIQMPSFPSPALDTRLRDTILGVLEWLVMLLRIIATKASLFSMEGGLPLAKMAQNEQIKIIALLASIATQPTLGQLLQSDLEEGLKAKLRDCVSFTLDVAARLADDLSEEARVLCTRILKDRLRDERIQWLVGSMLTCAALNNFVGHGLLMMHENKGYVGEFRPKQWEMLESGGGKENDTCFGLGLFGARRI